MYACLAVTCQLHFWQNDRDLLRATAVTRGCNGYRNKSQHRKSTLEKKILPPLLQGFEPATFQSWLRRSNHWAIPAPFGATHCALQHFLLRENTFFFFFFFFLDNFCIVWFSNGHKLTALYNILQLFLKVKWEKNRRWHFHESYTYMTTDNIYIHTKIYNVQVSYEKQQYTIVQQKRQRLRRISPTLVWFLFEWRLNIRPCSLSPDTFWVRLAYRKW